MATLGGTVQGSHPSLAIKTMNKLLVSVLMLAACAGSAFAQQKVDINRGAQIAQTCAACHGADGNATGPVNPKLAAQHADYLYKQLQNFKLKPGAKEPERNNAVMLGFATALSDQDMRDVSAYFEAQKLKPASGKNEKELRALGERIYRGGIAAKQVPACAACHGPAGAGLPANFPRLGGQWAEYTEAQMIAFRQGTRKNSAMMASIAARMSDQEIKAVSDYIAALR
jgi:cytochrome c553